MYLLGSRKGKKNCKRVLVAMCSPASSFHVSVPIFSSCLRFHTLACVHTTASCHREQNCELGVHRKAARLEEGCSASLHAEVNAKSTSRRHNSLLLLFFLNGSGLCKGAANNIIFDAQDMKFVRKHTHSHYDIVLYVLITE